MAQQFSFQLTYWKLLKKLCNKVAIIKEGKIVAKGNTLDIISNKSLENIFMELAETS